MVYDTFPYDKTGLDVHLSILKEVNGNEELPINVDIALRAVNVDFMVQFLKQSVFYAISSGKRIHLFICDFANANVNALQQISNQHFKIDLYGVTTPIAIDYNHTSLTSLIKREHTRRRFPFPKFKDLTENNIEDFCADCYK